MFDLLYFYSLRLFLCSLKDVKATFLLNFWVRAGNPWIAPSRSYPEHLWPRIDTSDTQDEGMTGTQPRCHPFWKSRWSESILSTKGTGNGGEFSSCLRILLLHVLYHNYNTLRAYYAKAADPISCELHALH